MCTAATSTTSTTRRTSSSRRSHRSRCRSTATRWATTAGSRWTWRPRHSGSWPEGLAPRTAFLDPALPLRQARPATLAFVLARELEPGARRAADRGVAEVVQRVVREVVLLQIRPRVAAGPRGDRVHLDDPRAGVELVAIHDRRVRPRRGRVSTDLDDPATQA